VNGTLGGRVGCVTSAAPFPPNRTEVDDCPGISRSQYEDCRATHVEHPLDVHCKDTPPLLVGSLVRGRANDNAGGIDENIHSAAFVDNGSYGRVAKSGLGHIPDNRSSVNLSGN
jgi:hypothetical protein